MFYNDVSSIIGFDIGNKKEVTCKKASFYNLFVKGNQSSLSKYSIDEELNVYVENALDDIKDVCKEIFLQYSLSTKSSGSIGTDNKRIEKD
ncbi:hypothetical protein [Clostridium uliginosum]|uniref:Uncharacterized protein n=1 Tax=Clostridium uliginosum TaxID=119641 RepID=A0A1I1HAX3_9CLOT|nr:hypothetical protein [Clostridium uliginosum]SFC21299.1 hypothetical protein SAMN05421842_101250 [Clostridium uliginosum]